jgi:Mg2+ and Co2+ transporter CorA
MAGMVKFSLSGGDIDHPYENWMKFFYLIGMGLLILSPWCILLFKTTGWNQNPLLVGQCN